VPNGTEQLELPPLQGWSSCRQDQSQIAVTIREIGDAVAFENDAPCGLDLPCDTRGSIVIASTHSDPNGIGWAH